MCGLVEWGGSGEDCVLIVCGQVCLLENVEVSEDLECICLLFDDLECKQELIVLMDKVRDVEGVCLFIGVENLFFSLLGFSVIVVFYMNSEQQIVGVLGVIGFMCLNYVCVIFFVDYIV